jgi:hypothetical protein
MLANINKNINRHRNLCLTWRPLIHVILDLLQIKFNETYITHTHIYIYICIYIYPHIIKSVAFLTFYR